MDKTATLNRGNVLAKKQLEKRPLFNPDVAVCDATMLNNGRMPTTKNAFSAFQLPPSALNPSQFSLLSTHSQLTIHHSLLRGGHPHPLLHMPWLLYFLDHKVSNVAGCYKIFIRRGWVSIIGNIVTGCIFIIDSRSANKSPVEV